MRRIATLIVFLLGLLSLEAGAQNLAVESFVLAETDLTANMEGTAVRDQNGEICALIKVETTQKGFTFDVGILGVTSVVEKTGEIWVYVPFGIRKITIMHPQLGMLRDYQIPCVIEKGLTYIMKLTAGSVRTIVEYAPTKQYLQISLNPTDAILEVDGKMKSTTDGVYQELLPFGQYKYKVLRQDYHDVEGMVEVSDPDNAHRLNITLMPAFGYVSVINTSQPDIKDAVVYIDEKMVGKIPAQDLRLTSGTHTIRVNKELYNTYNASFEVSDEENKVINIELIPVFAEVTLESVSDAEIYVDGEYKGKGSWSGRLEYGSYIFETRKPGHFPFKMPYDITTADLNRLIVIPAPTPLYGSLNISSTPSDAKIYIDGKHVGETPIYIGRQIVGDYSVKVEVDGYESQTKKVSVTEGEETAVSFMLQKTARTASSTPSSTVSYMPPSTSRSGDSGLPVNLSDNWFIGIGGGFNIILNEGSAADNIMISPSIDVNFGKWITPAVGMRIGYQGIYTQWYASNPSILGSTLDTQENMYAKKMGYMYVHGDLLWNISNAIGGNRETRFWNFVPYVHTGFLRSYGMQNVDYTNNELALGAGLLHNLRLAKRLDIIIDMRATVVNGRVNEHKGVAVLPTVTAGLAVNLGVKQ